MLKYLTGNISSLEIPGETILRIYLTDGKGKNLEEHLPLILNMYTKHVTCIELVHGEGSQADLVNIFALIRNAKLRTIWKTSLQDDTQVTERLSNVLDYLWLGETLCQKDYSPFGDAVVWLETKTRTFEQEKA